MELKIGEKIRGKRKEKGMTLKDLAGEKVTASQISAVEKGKCNPSIGLLKYIAEKLEVNIDYFTLTTEERFRRSFDEIEKKARAMLNKGEFEEACKCFDEAENMLPFIADNQKGFYNFVKGELVYRKRLYDDAFEYYLRSLTCYMKSKDTLETGKLYLRMGDCLFATKKYDLALGYYLTAHNSKIKNEYIYIYSACKAALCSIFLDRYDNAAAFADKMKEYFRDCEWEYKDRFLPTLSLIEGLISRKQSRYEYSINKFNEAFCRYNNINNSDGMGITKNFEALCFWDIGDNDKAIECLKEAIAYKSINGESSLVDSYINLANIYKEIGDKDKYLEIINETEEKMLELNFVPGIIKVFFKKFDYFVELEDFDRAEIFAFIALDYIQKSKDYHREYDLYMKMSEMYEKMSDNKNLVDYIYKAKALNI